MAEKLCSDFDDLTFYLMQVDGFKSPENFHKYVNSASFNICSVRDELKILLSKEVERGYIERINKNQDRDI